MDIEKIKDHVYNVLAKYIVNKWAYIGEEFVTNARQNHTYRDRTGNLTSSIGYVIVSLGKIVVENFEVAEDGEEGLQKGKELAAEIAARYPYGFALICVAKNIAN